MSVEDENLSRKKSEKDEKSSRKISGENRK